MSEIFRKPRMGGIAFVLAIIFSYSGADVAYATHEKGCGVEKTTVEICTRIIESGKFNNNRGKLAATYNSRGNAYFSKRKFYQAIEDYNRALKLSPNYTKAYYDRGRSYYVIKKYDLAIKDFNRFIRFNPKHARAYFIRGSAFYRQRKRELAIEDYRKALQLNPKMSSARKALKHAVEMKRTLKNYNKVFAEEMMGILKNSNGVFEGKTRLKQNSTKAKAYNSRGLSYSSKGDYKRAIANFTEALKLRPKYINAYNSRGYAYLRSGLTRRAVADFEKAISLNPKNGRIYHSLGEGLYYDGQKDKAMKVWKKACALVSRKKTTSWQRKLKKAGYYSGKVDGKCGFGTVIGFASCAEVKCRAL